MMRRLALLPLLLAASPALAHPGHEAGSVLAGLGHPIGGADHVLAMVAVGLWAALLGGRALWAVPAAFVGAMALGFGLARAGVGLPLVEPMILASCVILGLAAALAVRLPLAASAALVGAFALFHGHAHGAETGPSGALAFALGFVAATALLHAAGVALGLLGARSARLLGAAAALSGVALALA